MQILSYPNIFMYISLCLIYFQIAMIKASGLFMPFMLYVEGDHHVKILEDLFSLRFNIRIGFMYVE